jgi:heat shock protein HslJ
MNRNAWLPCVAALAAGLPGTVAAGDEPLICFGNEPSWSVDLTEPGVARFSTPDQEAVAYRGTATRHAFLKETLWRGSPPSGRDLVVWLQDSTCTDNMSGNTLPVTARVSTPDGRFLSGCCRVATTTKAGNTMTSLDGTGWQLKELPGTEPGTLAKLGRPVAVRFESGRVSGFAGCNNFTGSYKLEGDRLAIGPVASTQMACPGPGSDVEQAFHRALQGSWRVEVSGNDLTARTDSGATLRFEREAPPQLAGIDWKVTSFNNNRHAVVGVIGESRLTLAFKDGQVTGSAGCNNFRGSYKAEGGRIQIGPLATTRRACAEELMTQEKEFLAALASAVTWKIDGNVLDLHRADGERAIWAVSK